MSTEKDKLKEQYEDLYGKKPFHGWDEEALKQKIEEFDGTQVDEPKTKETAPKHEKFMGIVLDPEKTYEFRLKHRQNPMTFIPREAKVWDEENKKTRMLNLSSAEDSPYTDEQDVDSPTDATAIVFTNGRVLINGIEKAKIKFLLAFDGFDQKKKILPVNESVRDMYELIDHDKLGEAAVKREEDIQDAKQIVRKATKAELANFMRSVYLLPVDSMSSDEIKKSAYDSADVDPTVILKEFTDPKHAIKGNIQKLFSKNALTDEGGYIKWKDTEGVITQYDESTSRADEALAKWVLIGGTGVKEFKERMASKLS